MAQCSHHGRETAYTVAAGGHRPRALYVHGSGANRHAWAIQYTHGPFGPAAAVDLSGHGDSGDVTTAAGPETLAAYADDVVAVARTFDPDVLVGHSLGGAVVLQCLLADRLSPRGVVLAGTGAKLAVHESIRRMLREQFDALADTLHGNADLPDESDSAATAREALLSAGQRVTLRDFMTCHEFDVRDRLAELSLPALAVVGDHDSLTPPSYHDFLAERMQRCELAVLEDATHLAMLERPGPFHAALATLADRL